MAVHEAHHVELIEGIAEQFKTILDKSEQAIYLYLDDTHKVCNRKFADLLGYKSPGEWADTEAPLADVVEEDQEAEMSAYENASEKLNASCLDITMKNVKTGKRVKARLVMAPVAYQGHVIVMHFLSRL